MPKKVIPSDLDFLIPRLAELESQIAEYRWAEQNLDNYKMLFDNISDLAYIFDDKGNILYMNKTFARLTGKRTEDFIGRPFAPLFDEENLKSALENYIMTLDGESPQFELRFKDTGILCEYKSMPLRDGKRKIIGVIGTARDITERKKAELVLRQRDSVLEAVRVVSEELLGAGSAERAFETALKKLGEAVSVSRAYIFKNHSSDDGTLFTSQLYEWSAPGVMPQIDNQELQGFHYRGSGFSRWVDAMEGGAIVEGHVREFPEAEKILFESQDIKSMAAVPIFVENSWWGFIGFDECAEEREWPALVIDALKAAAGAIGSAMQRRLIEEKLRKTAVTLMEAQRLSLIGSWEWDIARNVLSWSEGLFDIFGVGPENLKKDAYEAFIGCIHIDDRQEVDSTIRKALSDKRPFSFEFRIVRLDGDLRHIHTRGQVICNEAGTPVKMFGTGQDITERKLADQKMRESEEQFRVIFENSSDGLLVTDPRTLKLVFWNKKFCHMLGYGEEELKGMSIPDLHRAEDLSRAAEDFEKLNRGEMLFFKDVAFKRKDGSIFYADINTSQIRLAGNDLVLGALRDITARKRTEDELNRYKSNLEAIFRSVKEAIISVDLDLHVTEVNETAKSICGIDRTGIGESLKGLTKSSCSFKCLAALDETISGGSPVEVFRLECGRTGKPHQTVTLNTYPLIDSAGRFTGAVLVVSDETRLVDLEKDLGERRQLHNIIGKSDKMRELFRLIESLAGIDSTVLISGESGTGKELAAEALHYTGIRSNKPLVKVNCAAIPEYLLESELFGHVKGAFTGAVRDRVGRFELANGGTVFLDEIGDVPPETQLRLLRVIQEKEFERLGDSKTIRMDVRVIAATNRELTEKVKKGEFREDLYYRLKVVELTMPALRERLDDLPLLEDHFIKKFSKKFKKNIKGLSPEVRKIFMNYPWPGNIRELEHAFERAFIVCPDSTINVNDLPPSLREYSGSGTPLGGYDEPDERELIENTLRETGWNKKKAANRLCISRTTLYRKLEKYNLHE